MRMLIDGQWVEAEGEGWIEVCNPADDVLIDRVPSASLVDAARAVEAAQHGKQRMAALPAHERATILIRAAELMEQQIHPLGELLARENGKPIQQTRDEVRVTARIFRGFGEEAKRVFGRVIPMDAVPGNERHVAMTIRQPIGVVAAIVPFNYPVELFSHKAASALAAGNAVITKPPARCPLTVLKIAEIMEQAGLPRAAHQVITGPGDLLGDYLVAHPDIQMVTFTGSTATGQRISKLAAESLKRVQLELGGNDAQIICADADLERAAEAVVLGRLARGNGQICCAVKRIFVEAPVYDQFAEILSEKARRLKVGDQLEEDTDVGPLIDTGAAEEVEAAIHEAEAIGAKVLAGGHRHGSFVEPTVIGSVPLGSSLLREEVFGPVAPIVPFHDIREAVELANSSRFGLQGAVFTNDISRAFDIAYRLEVGGVIVNWSTAVRVETLAFGGVKFSGHGREAIHDTLLEMTNQKSILFFNALSPQETEI